MVWSPAFDVLGSIEDFFVGDSATAFNTTGRPECVYDRYKPPGDMRFVMVGNIWLESISYFDKIYVISQCETVMKMTMHDLFVVDNLAFNTFSFL